MTRNLDFLIVGSDIVIAVMLTIILIAISKENSKNERNKMFFYCIIFTIASILCEICNYTLEGNEMHTGFLYVTNYGTVIAGEGIVIFLAKYAYECVKEKTDTKDWFIKIVIILCAIDTIIQTYGAITGKSFIIENAKFAGKDLYDITFITSGICLVIIKAFLKINSKKIGNYLNRIFTLYYILPIISMIVIVINVEWSFVLQSVALSFLIIYIGIEKEEKERILFTLINKDGFTNLLNRGAFNKKIEELRGARKNIEIIWSDLNNLKYANDNFGHAAGDSLIKTYVDILKDVFGDDEIYRIGGDEFVIVIEGDNNDDKIEKFKNKIVDNKNIACFGNEKGNTNEIDEILRKSESKMYQHKEKYYKENGIDRRRA